MNSSLLREASCTRARASCPSVTRSRKLSIGHSDDVSVFLNDSILYRGRSAQNFRDPGFLGIVSSENDAIYVPLKKDRNELLLAVSELGGGWGFICRLAPLRPSTGPW